MKGIFLGVILSEGWNYPSKIDNRPSLAQKKIYLRDAKRSRGLRFIFSEDHLVTKYHKIRDGNPAKQIADSDSIADFFHCGSGFGFQF